MRKLGRIGGSFVVAAALTGAAQGAVLYSTSGSTYTQSFDSLPNTPTNTSLGASPTGWKDDDAAPGAGNFSISGWYLDHRSTAAEGGFNGHQRMRIGAGNGTTGAFHSFGVNSTTDRSLGIFPASTLAGNGDSMRIGLRLTNTTGTPLTSFTITYDGEQYKDSAASNTMSFSYAMNVDETNWHTAGVNAVFVSGATFTPPVANNPVSPATVLGNTDGAVRDITATVDLSATPWLPGTDLFLRWSQIQVASLDDDGLGIDNVRFSAVPEPTGLAVLALGGLGLMARRRSK